MDQMSRLAEETDSTVVLAGGARRWPWDWHDEGEDDCGEDEGGEDYCGDHKNVEKKISLGRETFC